MQGSGGGQIEDSSSFVRVFLSLSSLSPSLRSRFDQKILNCARQEEVKILLCTMKILLCFHDDVIHLPLVTFMIVEFEDRERV